MAKNNAEKSEKKLVSRREFLVGSSAVIAAIALAACASKTTALTTTNVTSTLATTPTTVPPTISSTQPQQTPTPPSMTSPTPGTTSTLTPKYGGTMRKFGGGDQTPFGWPPDMISTDLGQYCLETLLRGDENGGVYPWLAESYKLADDFTSITFNLRKGVTFHDGSDFNAGVAKWNLDNMINAKKEPDWTSKDVAVAIQSFLAEVGIQANLDFPEIGRYFTYAGPNNSWPENVALYTIIPSTDGYYLVGLEYIFAQFGKSWLKTPELSQAYQAALSSPNLDVKLVRTVRNMISDNAWIIPVQQGGAGMAMKEYVMTDYGNRGLYDAWNTEEVWLNK